MDIKTHYPEYAPIEKHIRAARIERVVVIAEGLAEFIVSCRNALLAPPAPAAVIIEVPRKTLSDGVRSFALAPRNQQALWN